MNSLSMTSATVLVAFLSLLWLLLWQWWPLTLKRQLRGRPPPPPGNLGLPLLGETLVYLRQSKNNDTEGFCRERAAKFGRCFITSLLGTPTVVMDPPAGFKFLFANEGKLVENSWPDSMSTLLGKNSLTFKTGEDYRVARRHFSGFLSPDAIAKYLSRVENNVRAVLETQWEPAAAGAARGQKDGISAEKLTKQFTFGVVADLCISLREGPESSALREAFSIWASGLMQVPLNLPGFAYHRAFKARAVIMKKMDELIVKRRTELQEGKATPTQDVLSNLLTKPDETGRINTDEEIKDNIMLLLFAGHDTSSSVLAMVIRNVAMYPEVRRGLEKEFNEIASKKDVETLKIEDVRNMKYAWRVIQETMRMQPAVAGAFRQAITDFQYNGYTILKGWKLFWNNQYSHTDPKLFPNPTVFDPSRFEGSGPLPFSYVPFGGGPRLCPGNEFAKMEMLVFLYWVIRKYDWTLVDPKEKPIRTPFPRMPNGMLIKINKK